ncbi:MAG: hypothetical protein V4613_10855 [Bacteroidota bacterium]
MNLKSTLLIAITAFSYNAATAQDVDREEVKINYISRPLKPINKEIKNYNSTVVLAYLEANKTLMANYELEVKRNDEEHAKAMEQYNKDLDVYNKKSAAKKLLDKELNNEGKPIMPIKKTLERPTPQKEHNPTLLANTYLKLQGFKLGTDNAVKITATLMGFEMMGPTLITTESSEMRSGQSVKVTKYKYEIQYRHPMGVKVESPTDGILMEEFTPSMNDFQKAYTGEYSNTYDLDKYWNMSKGAFISGLEDKTLTANMTILGNIINTNYGYQAVTRESNVYTVKDKKGNYEDYATAQTAYEEGYKLLSESAEKTNAIPKIKEAIAIWETAMKESDPSNKKARIDESVSIATLFNLIEANIWADDFEKAEKYWKQLAKLDLGKKEQKRHEELEAFMKDQKARYMAGK